MFFYDNFLSFQKFEKRYNSNEMNEEKKKEVRGSRMKKKQKNISILKRKVRRNK